MIISLLLYVFALYLLYKTAEWGEMGGGPGCAQVLVYVVFILVALWTCSGQP